MKERGIIKAEKKAAEDASYQYKAQIRKIKQERAGEERAKRNQEYEERKRAREADKLDEQPYVQEIALVEQCTLWLKNLTQAVDAPKFGSTHFPLPFPHMFTLNPCDWGSGYWAMPFKNDFRDAA